MKRPPLVPRIAVDSVRYNDTAPWPVEADGQGASLQRVDPTAYANDPANWIANFRGGTPGDEPPRVSEVLLFGSSWSAGRSIPAGAAQLTPAPNSGVEEIRIRFTHDVLVSADDLTITVAVDSIFSRLGEGAAQAAATSDDPNRLMSESRSDNRIRKRVDRRDPFSTHNLPLRRLQATAVDLAIADFAAENLNRCNSQLELL